MRISFIFALLLGFTLAPPAQAQMKEFVSREGRFSVMMPGTPIVKNQNLDLGDKGKTVIYGFYAGRGANVFLVTYTDYPLAMVTPPQRILFPFRLNAMTNRTLLSESNIGLKDGAPYILRLHEATGHGDIIYESRSYIIGGRSYQILATGSPADSQKPEWQTFLDSFKILQ